MQEEVCRYGFQYTLALGKPLFVVSIMITSTQALKIARKTNGRCFYCNKPAEEIDHFISKNSWLNDEYIHRGFNSVDDTANLVPSCLKCNRSKNSKSPDEFIGNSFLAWRRLRRCNERVGINIEVDEWVEIYDVEMFSHSYKFFISKKRKIIERLYIKTAKKHGLV